MILKPKEEWPIAAAEPATIGGLFSGYIIPLAAIGPVAGLIGSTVFGIPLPLLGTYHPPLMTSITSAIVAYVATLLGCYIMAVVAEMLAPSFSGVKDRVAGLKLAAYSSTPTWVVGIVRIFPPLGIIVLLAALWGLYVLYLGVPEAMKVPKEKAIGFIVVLIIVEIVVFFAIGAVTASVTAMVGGGAGYPSIR